jgi:hypothetical protein
MIDGMRGTDQLAPERRSRKMTRRTQPYRKRHGRTLGPTLTAMLKGSPTFLPNPMDLRRQAQKRRGRRA